MLKTKQLRILAFACAIVLSFGLFACSSQSDTSSSDESSTEATATDESSTDEASSEEATSEVTDIKIGASAQTVPLVESGIPAMEAKGYTVEVVTFDDYNTPNRAVDEGEITCNFYQHAPFLEEYNANNNTDLVMLDPAIWNFFSALYSTKYASVEDLPEGAQIAIANDASNISLELEYLQEWGLITLADEPSDAGLYTELDIVDNPKGFEFLYTDDTQRYSTMDEYDAFFGASDKLFIEGYDPTENMIAQKVEERTSLGIAVRAEDAGSQWASDLIDAYLSDEAIASVDENLGGAFVLSEAAQNARK